MKLFSISKTKSGLILTESHVFWQWLAALQIGYSPDNGSFHKYSYPFPADITNLHTSLQIKEIFKYLI